MTSKRASSLLRHAPNTSAWHSSPGGRSCRLRSGRLHRAICEDAEDGRERERAWTDVCGSDADEICPSSNRFDSVVAGASPTSSPSSTLTPATGSCGTRPPVAALLDS
eukprot:2077747-Rhodomonas_salina.5